MTLSDLAAIGSFVSGLAVVIALVFVSMQIRQTNKNQRALMQHGRSTRNIETFAHSMAPHVGCSFRLAMRADLSMDAMETNTGINVTYMMFMNFGDSLLQYRAGTIDPASWASDERRLRLYVARTAFRAGWGLRHAYFGDAFRDCIDRRMSETTVTQPTDETSVWKTYVTEEIAAAS